jgi:hypothetical protein
VEEEVAIDHIGREIGVIGVEVEIDIIEILNVEDTPLKKETPNYTKPTNDNPQAPHHHLPLKAILDQLLPHHLNLQI